MSIPSDAAREEARQHNGRFGPQTHQRATGVRIGPLQRHLDVDPDIRIDDELPDVADPIELEAPEISLADQKRVEAVSRTSGPGPHLDRLDDTERAALIAHLARIDETISRHLGGTAADSDYPGGVDAAAEAYEGYLHRGGMPDDPTEIDYAYLSDMAVDELREIRSGWVDYAEAVSSARPLI